MTERKDGFYWVKTEEWSIVEFNKGLWNVIGSSMSFDNDEMEAIGEIGHKVERSIIPVKQHALTCMSASIAMVTGMDHDAVVEEFDQRYHAGETLAHEFLTKHGFKWKRYYNDEYFGISKEDAGKYILSLPSLNLLNETHAIVAELYWEDQILWTLHDPNKGRGDCLYYTECSQHADQNELAVLIECPYNAEYKVWR